MRKILYITQWFDPEPNIIKGPAFVRELEASGYEVEVLTGLPNYPTGKLFPGYRVRLFQRETIGEVRVMRVPLYPSHGTSSLGRGLNFLSFFASVLVFLLLRGNRYDQWYVYHPPITVGLAAALARTVVRRPFTLEIQDLWPDTVTASGMAGTGRVGRLLGALCNFTYARAKRIITQSQGMKNRLLERGVPAKKVSVIYNWADDTAGALPPPDRAARGFDEAFTIVYGGNLGRMQALDTALAAMATLRDRECQAELVLVGDGIERIALEAEAERLGLTNVRFVGRVPQDMIGHWFAAADALLLHIASDPLFEITIPSKCQYYLACGRPIVAGIDGEAASILDASGGAIVVPPQDAETLADAIERMASLSPARRSDMGNAGRAYYKEHLGFERGIAQTLQALDSDR